MPLLRLNGRIHAGTINRRDDSVRHYSGLTVGERAMIHFMNQQKIMNNCSWPDVSKCIAKRK